ncbi:hypothetical protein D3C74_454840 [compost metagenome]
MLLINSCSPVIRKQVIGMRVKVLVLLQKSFEEEKACPGFASVFTPALSDLIQRKGAGIVRIIKVKQTAAE